MPNRRSPTVLFLALLVALLAPVANAQVIRVLIADRVSPTNLSIEAGGSGILLATNTEDGLVASGAVAVSYSKTEQSLSVTTDAGQTFSFPDSLVLDSVGEALLTIRFSDDPALEPRRFEGELRIYPDDSNSSLQVVNHAPVESYLASVVRSEYGLDDLEGTKAMAIVARTYAARAVKTNGRFDVYDDTRSQVFHGVARGDARSSAAVEATAGMILVHNGQPIEAVYHASSGGHTANNEDVWSSNVVPYLRGVPDEFDTSDYISWVTVVSAEELHALLSEKYDSDVVELHGGDYDESGRLKTASIVLSSGETLQVAANSLRLAVISKFGSQALKSLRFDIVRRSDIYRFEGSGYGHGVGLGQWGAHGMAVSGHTAEEILAHYYQGTRLAMLESDWTTVGELRHTLQPVRLQKRTPKRETGKSKRIGW